MRTGIVQRPCIAVTTFGVGFRTMLPPPDNKMLSSINRRLELSHHQQYNSGAPDPYNASISSQYGPPGGRGGSGGGYYDANGLPVSRFPSDQYGPQYGPGGLPSPGGSYPQYNQQDNQQYGRGMYSSGPPSPTAGPAVQPPGMPQMVAMPLAPGMPPVVGYIIPYEQGLYQQLTAGGEGGSVSGRASARHSRRVSDDSYTDTDLEVRAPGTMCLLALAMASLMATNS